LDTQKKSLSASERDEVKRAAWREDVQQVPAGTLVFVDESGSHTSMTPLYGWAPKNERAYGVTPRNRGQNTTILGALSPQGVQAAMTLAGAADTIAFEVFIEQVLVPTLQPGQTVVMDNLSIHKGQTTRQLIENCGCTLLFLPAYSPDFSPIEQAWSKLKAHLRRVGARAKEALQEAIADGLQLITPQDAQAWFNHCGYSC
jgi:transposase